MVEAYIRFGTLRGIFGRTVEFDYKDPVDDKWYTEKLPFSEDWADEEIEALADSLNDDFDFYIRDGYVTDIKPPE